MKVIESLYIENQGITFVTCQGDDITLGTKIKEFSVGGVTYKALKPEVYTSLSGTLQLTFGIDGKHDIPRGEIDTA